MRQPKPFFREQTKSWYVQLGKKQVNLGADKADAFRKYHSLMADRQAIAPSSTVLAILHKFLTWNKQHRSGGTQTFYERPVLSFAAHVGQALTIDKLKPFHVTEWLNGAYATAGANYRRNCIRAVQRAFNWAVEEGHLTESPLKKVKKPAYAPRDAVIEPETWKQIAEAIQAAGGSGEFIDFVTILRHTGCRPQEARLIEARHIDRRNKCLVFERDESKGHGGSRTVERRVVPLSDEAYAICVKLAKRWPDGAIFRNEEGRAWTRRAVGKRFERLSRKLKKKHGWKKGVSAYLLRHTWATEALERGVDPITVATIMGHKDLTQLMKTYQHLKHKGEHLRQSLAVAIGLPANTSLAG